MNAVTMFFIGTIFVFLIVRAFFSKRNISVSPFDLYMMQKLTNTEFWNLQNENTCEYNLYISPSGQRRVFVSVYDYVNCIRYSYVVNSDGFKNKVKRLGYEKVCVGKVGFP